ncbi:MAG: DUF1127 domain-containing protein [Candidatus Contendobacter sp.]|nr:DUF1127 domain-containing protein [Candidatus Contendobacter sp.]MDG4557410.1 DUF1127 domain-containing protein [Candidatus Contendobacter sp.]
MLRSATLKLEFFAERPLNIRALLARARRQVAEWYEIHRQRHALLGLSDAMLKDIGIGRADAFREGTKPFWRS